jgi:hypothetical protein
MALRSTSRPATDLTYRATGTTSSLNEFMANIGANAMLDPGVMHVHVCMVSGCIMTRNVTFVRPHTYHTGTTSQIFPPYSDMAVAALPLHSSSWTSLTGMGVNALQV